MRERKAEWKRHTRNHDGKRALRGNKDTVHSFDDEGIIKKKIQEISNV